MPCNPLTCQSDRKSPPNQLELYNDPILNDSIRKSNGTISLRDLNIDRMLRPSPFLPTRKRRKKSRWELKIIRGVQPKLDLSLPEYIGNYIYFAPSLRPIRDYCGSANAVFIPFFYICQRRRRKKIAYTFDCGGLEHGKY